MMNKRFGSLILTASSLFLLSGCPDTNPGSTVTQGAQTDSIKKTVTSLKTDIQNVKGSITGLASSLQTILVSLSSPAHLNAYRTLAVTSITNNGTTIAWDDTTGQLTTISDANNEFTFGFSGKDQPARTATFAITKSADNTTGTCSLAVTGTWSNTATESETPPPFEIWYNQMPEMASITAASGKITLVPQGLQANKMEVEAGADTLANLDIAVATNSENPINPFADKIFTHYTLKGYVPKLAFDNSLTLRKGGTSLIEITYGGSFTTEIEGKTENWTLSATMTTDLSKEDQNGQIAYSIENTSNGYKLAGSVNAQGKTATFYGKFTSNTSNTELANITFDSTKDTCPLITYADGTSEKLVF